MAASTEKPEPYKIIVTGFGTFVGHEHINASWEAVRQLPDVHSMPNGRQLQLHKQCIDVEYAAVDKAVTEIWSGKPDFVVHCGVNGHCQAINLECNAVNGDFCRADAAGKMLDTKTAAQRERSHDALCQPAASLSTTLDVQRMVGELEECHPDVQYAVSTNVGNYLCGYIYYKSLDHNADRTIFVHVPPIDKPFTTEATTQALLHTIEKCVAQIR